MFFFSTVTAPSVLSTSQQPVPVLGRQQKHAWQRDFMQSMFATKQPEPMLISEPRALRRQIQPTYRISLRRRVTDALNSPFNYQMTEAARVVL